MHAKPVTAEKISVILVRMGFGQEEVVLPVRATLADLLHEAQIQTEGRSLYVDGFLRTGHFILEWGMVVILPSPKNERWRTTIGMFADDPTYQDFIDRVQARRERDRERARRQS